MPHFTEALLLQSLSTSTLQSCLLMPSSTFLITCINWYFLSCLHFPRATTAQLWLSQVLKSLLSLCFVPQAAQPLCLPLCLCSPPAYLASSKAQDFLVLFHHPQPSSHLSPTYLILVLLLSSLGPHGPWSPAPVHPSPATEPQLLQAAELLFHTTIPNSIQPTEQLCLHLHHLHLWPLPSLLPL